MENFRVGDRVVIKDNGQAFSTYDEWFDRYAPELASRYAYNQSPKNGKLCVVKAICRHGFSDEILVAVEDKTSYYEPIYLIGQDGLEVYHA